MSATKLPAHMKRITVDVPDDKMCIDEVKRVAKLITYEKGDMVKGRLEKKNRESAKKK